MNTPNSPPDDRVLELEPINVPRSTSSANVLEIEPLRCPDLEIGVIDR
jgi:hypothetical protein